MLLTNSITTQSSTEQPAYRESTPRLSPSSNALEPTEFQLSAIPDSLVAANVQWVEGQTAVEILTENALTGRNSHGSQRTAYLTANDRRLLDKYEFAREGMWVVYGQDIDGNPGTVAYGKPVKPRTARSGGFGESKAKVIKYETPVGQEAKPVLLWVDDETAAKVYRRYNITPTEGENFWTVVWRYNLPICIVEGFKKQASLVAKGIPAIALRGVYNWHRKGTDELHEELATFATEGRQLLICFDRDSKPKTVRAVETQIDKLAKVLERKKCKVSIFSWDGELGKGIDDAIYRVQSEKGEASAQAWVDGLFESALSYKCWKRDKNIRRWLEIIHQLNTPTYPVERATEGEYLPELPKFTPGAIHVLNASMYSGKTYRIGRDWVQSAIADGWRVVVNNPRNALGQQTANDWGLPHIHDYALDKDSQTALWADVANSGGIVMCFDSLHRLPPWFFERDGRPCPILWVLDEANQGAYHLTNGGTLGGGRWEEIMGLSAAIARHGMKHGAIVLAEDGIPDRTVEFIQKLAVAGDVNATLPPVRAFTHHRKATPWDATLYKGRASGFRRGFLNAIQRRQKPAFVTSSQAEGERLERELQKRFGKTRKVVRVDSKTNENGQFREFFTNPDKWLEEHQPDILILSPSAQTGLSIQGGIPIESAYFDSVWGYFTSLACGAWMQLLGRFRPAVPRHIYVPPMIQTTADERIGASWAIKARWEKNARGLGKLVDREADLNEQSIRELEISQAALEYLSKSVAVAGAEKSIAFDALADRLQRAGHHIRIEEVKHDKEIAVSWKATQEELWQEAATFAAALEIDPDRHTKSWAIEQRNSTDAGHETRVRAQKVLWRDEFPGISFDDTEECYHAIYRDYGRMKDRVKIQAMTEMPDKAKLVDAPAIDAILNSNIQALHRLPKDAARAVLLNHLGVLDLTDGTEYNNGDPRAIAVKQKALKFRNEIRYWLNLNVEETQTPVEIGHKLLRRFGLEITRENRPGAIEVVGRPGKRGEQHNRIYRCNLDFNPIRSKLLEAYRSKLSETTYTPVSTISNSSNPYIETTDTKPKIPINEDVAGVAAILEDGVGDPNFDSEALKAVVANLSPEEKRNLWSLLGSKTQNWARRIAG